MNAKMIRGLVASGVIAGVGSVVAGLGLAGVPIPDPYRLLGCTISAVLIVAAIFGGIIDSLVKKGVIK